MSEAKFTPAPWKWATSNSWRRLIGDAEYGPHTTFVLVPFVARDGHPDMNVSEPDMALIEAAPDMYEALKQIANYGEEENEWDAVIRYDLVRDIAKAALAKATP